MSIESLRRTNKALFSFQLTFKKLTLEMPESRTISAISDWGDGLRYALDAAATAQSSFRTHHSVLQKARKLTSEDAEFRDLVEETNRLYSDVFQSTGLLLKELPPLCVQSRKILHRLLADEWA